MMDNTLTDEQVLDMVAHVGSQFDAPDDDWIPTLLLLGENGRLNVCGLQLSEEMKGAMPAVVLQLFQEVRPVSAALVLSCWVVEQPASRLLEALIETESVRPSEHPDRVEKLMVETAGVGGESASYFADIIRHDGQPPTLSPWEKMPKADSGRMANLLPETFALWKTLQPGTQRGGRRVRDDELP